MNAISDNLAAKGASLLSVALMFGAATTASAVQINANADLDDVAGPVQTGSYNASGPTNVSARLGFSVPQGEFGNNFSSVVRSPNSVDFTARLNGNIATADSGLSGLLTADNSFNNGSAFNNFLTGGNQVQFDNVSFDFEYDVLDGRLGVLALDNPSASITDLSFAGGGTGLANTIGGTLNLFGNNDTLAVLDIYGTLAGGGKLIASSNVMESGAGGGVSVDAPSGLATLFLMSLSLVGTGVVAKRRQRKN